MPVSDDLAGFTLSYSCIHCGRPFTEIGSSRESHEEQCGIYKRAIYHQYLNPTSTDNKKWFGK